jgi:ABC-type multidrug transport system fused ATPase/permease subunit
MNKKIQYVFTECHKRIELDLGKEILKVENKCLDKNGSGMFIQRITSDVNRISEVFSNILMFGSDIIEEAGIYVAIFVISKEIFVAIAITTALKIVLEKVRTKRLNEYNKKWKKDNDKISTFIGEMIRGSRDIKMLNAEKGFLKKLKNDIVDINDLKYESVKVNRRYIFFRGNLTDLEDLLLIVLIIYLVNIGRLDVTLAVVVFNYFNRTGWISTALGNLLETVKDFNLSANRVFEIFDDELFAKEKFGKKHLNNVKGNFEFKDVSFKYEKRGVLKNLSFKVNSKETVAFVGKSGSGKTTIFNLLCKMYDAESGVITIDGIDIKELDKDSIRGNITIISQNPYIFNLSIKDNLRLVKEDLTEEEMIKACKIACLDEFINNLPDKYDTIVGEGGISLSGGQRQRLAIARALVQNTKIILFDEATSSLDNETQASIQKAIDNMHSEYTILIIAHRLSTIINCSHILFLDDGKILQQGTHEELLKSCKEYKKLYEAEIEK